MCVLYLHQILTLITQHSKYIAFAYSAKINGGQPQFFFVISFNYLSAGSTELDFMGRSRQDINGVVSLMWWRLASRQTPKIRWPLQGSHAITILHVTSLKMVIYEFYIFSIPIATLGLSHPLLLKLLLRYTVYIYIFFFHLFIVQSNNLCGF